MSNRAMYFESVEPIWIIWALCMPVIIFMVVRSFRGMNLDGWKQLIKEEDGAAYSLSFVMTMPFYTYFVCLVVELSLILLCKLGTVHAAYAVARNQIVMRSLSGDQQDLEKRARFVACRAMTPFGSDNPRHTNIITDALNSTLASGLSIVNYHLAAQAYIPELSKLVTKGQLFQKARYAYKATKVQIPPAHTRNADNTNGFVFCTVVYEYPFKVPIIGRILGQRNFFSALLGDNFYHYKLTTRVALPDEWPDCFFPANMSDRAPRGIPGIRYEIPQP
jgi:hypothetical protein